MENPVQYLKKKILRKIPFFLNRIFEFIDYSRIAKAILDRHLYGSSHHEVYIL